MVNKGAKLLEMELLNGDRIVGVINPSKMYGMVQKTRTKLRLCRNFPFFCTERIPYTVFRYRDTYEVVNSPDDSRYKVRCTIAELLTALGIDFVSVEEMRIKAACCGN